MRSRHRRKAVRSPDLASSIALRVSVSASPSSRASIASVVLLRAPFGLPAGLPDWPGLNQWSGFLSLRWFYSGQLSARHQATAVETSALAQPAPSSTSQFFLGSRLRFARRNGENRSGKKAKRLKTRHTVLLEMMGNREGWHDKDSVRLSGTQNRRRFGLSRSPSVGCRLR